MDIVVWVVDMLIIFIILSFAYAFAFKDDVPRKVVWRSVGFFMGTFALFNILEIVRFLGELIGMRILS